MNSNRSEEVTLGYMMLWGNDLPIQMRQTLPFLLKDTWVTPLPCPTNALIPHVLFIMSDYFSQKLTWPFILIHPLVGRRLSLPVLSWHCLCEYAATSVSPS